MSIGAGYKAIYFGVDLKSIYELSDISWRFFAYFSSRMFCH